ncbi:MAG TPA: hypothetical protein VJY42_00715 [Candidatus Methanomethylophilaceae archaeon]|nr:hypothetical protein [Candidatus Methanomethylophilaceae archaeon]
MKPKIERGSRGSFWSTKLSSDLSLLRKSDKNIVLITILALIPCIALCYYMAGTGNYNAYDMVPVLTLPLFFDGIIIYISEKRWKSFALLVIVVAALAAVHFLEYIILTPTTLFFFLFILIGGTGVVAIAEAIQRATFYSIVHSIEYMNVKNKMSFFDKMVSFLFNVPEDLDTRNITMNYNLQRMSIPWKEMMQTIGVALMLGMTIWIYISMNPAFMEPGTLDGVSQISIFMFSLVLIIPLLVLPFTIFKSLDVRVQTNYRAFHVHGGAMETIKRMALPIGATLIYVLLAINQADMMRVVAYIGASALAIVFVVGYTCLLYYSTNERPLVKDIAAKWKIFRPVPIFVSLDDDNNSRMSGGELPGTPSRDLSEFGELVLPKGR